jgi:hypothetical protein
MNFTEGALVAICDIFSRKTALELTHKLPYKELYRLSDANFGKLVEAVARGRQM